MKKVGETRLSFWSFNTCCHRGRIFNLHWAEQKLRMTEVILGETTRCVDADTGPTYIMAYNWPTACCSFGGHILVMAGKDDDVFAALIDVDDGPFDGTTIHTTALTVIGDKEWLDCPYLSSVSGSRALLYFNSHGTMWYCDVKEATLNLKKLTTRMPTESGFCTVPIPLPNGKLLVAGADPPSRHIVSISCDEEPKFENVGEIPGEGRSLTSAVLVGGRFVVGFGGKDKEYLEDLWIFDLEARKGSPVTKGGDWHPEDSLVPLVVQQDTIYLVGGDATTFIHSITLQALSELIQDADFQSVFQTSLGLRPRQHPPSKQDGDELPGMRALDGYFSDYCSHNTVDHQGRLLHFSQSDNKLCVTEIIFGPTLKTRTVDTEVSCKTSKDWMISCCSFGEKILVMAGDVGAGDVFCALLEIDPGTLARGSIHLEEKRVSGWEKYEDIPFLTQISECKVWASFNRSNEIWIGEIKGDEMVMTKHNDHLLLKYGFGASPLRLPDGRFLATGGWPPSTSISVITPGERFSFWKVGKFPGQGRGYVSTVLIKGRVMVGFGGMSYEWFGQPQPPVGDLWIFDFRTRKTSSVCREGKWHSEALWPVLVVRDQTLYIIGGRGTTTAHSLPFTTLSRLIQNRATRRVFRRCVRLALFPSKEYNPPFPRYFVSHWL